MDTAHPVGQLAAPGFEFHIGDQVIAVARCQVGRDPKNCAAVIRCAVFWPAIELLENVERKGIDISRRHLLGCQNSARAQIGWHINPQLLGCLAPADPERENDQPLQANHDPQRAQMGPHIIDFESVAAHSAFSLYPRTRCVVPKACDTAPSSADGYAAIAGNSLQAGRV